MEDRERRRWLTLLVLVMVVLLAGAAMWHRLVREGKLPMPGEWVLLLAFAGFLLLPLVGFLLYRTFALHTEDSAALSRRMMEEVHAPPPPRDYSQDYPMVFRPEWRGLASNAIVSLIALLGVIWRSPAVDVRNRLLAGAMVLSAFGLLAVFLLSRRLTISWPGVTLKEFRRERFWSWDQIEAVVLWQRRIRWRPALRLRTLLGEGELVSLGTMDFANEDLLFDVLVQRVQRLELQVDDHVIPLPAGPFADVRPVAELLLKPAWAAEPAAEEEPAEPPRVHAHEAGDRLDQVRH